MSKKEKISSMDRNELITKEYRISVNAKNDKVVLGIDVGCDGFFADLNASEVDQLIYMLKGAKKKMNQN